MEPIKFTTPVGKHKVELKPTVTGFDQEQIDAEYYTQGDLAPEQRANRKSIQILVLSVNGKSNNIVDDVLGMDLRDYKLVIAKLNELVEGIPDKKKSNSKKNTPS